MNHDEYVRIQIEEHGQVKKPLHYRIGQRKAIEWFFEDVPEDRRILDLGCGEGTGVKHLNSLGYENVVGIDLHPKKIALGRKMNLDVFQRDIYTCEFSAFDVVWSSHSFEHMLNPAIVVKILLERTTKFAEYFFIMPYPDTGTPRAHVASKEIGLYEDDNGVTLVNWFYDNGILCYFKKMDSFREKEIWMKCRRRE